MTREGEPGELYSADLDQTDGKVFLDRARDDRHQFRFIVSAEDASEYPDLKPFIRRLMTQVEQDLGTDLDWVAVDHFNTSHPHTHIMLRGVDDQGQNLVIAREYIARGFRERAVELVNLDLGPRTDLEIEARLRHDVSAERLTVIDRRLVRDMDAERVVTAIESDPFHQALRAGRLQTLGRLGLADDVGGGRWQLAEDLEETLRRIGERGDIIRTMQRELTARNLDRSGVEQRVYDPETEGTSPIVGRVITRGLSDEHRDRHYLLVDGVDGRTHYVDIGRSDGVDPTPVGSILRISARDPAVRDVDRTINAVARANAGVYSVDLHLRHDPGASRAFAEAHVRRLEAMRRAANVAERGVDGRWTIADDHLERVAAYEAQLSQYRPVTIETLSAIPVERQTQLDAPTWLDRTLVEAGELAIRDAGFGLEVHTAQAARRQWLVEQELAVEKLGMVNVPSNLLTILQRREFLRVAEDVSIATGKAFTETSSGARVDGMLTRKVELASGRMAVIEKARDFTLVPWKPILEKQLGKPVSGLVRDVGDSRSVNWSIGRDRGGPSMS